MDRGCDLALDQSRAVSLPRTLDSLGSNAMNRNAIIAVDWNAREAEVFAAQQRIEMIVGIRVDRGFKRENDWQFGLAGKARRFVS